VYDEGVQDILVLKLEDFCRMTTERVLQRLQTLQERNTKNVHAVNKDLYRLLCCEDFLAAAYQQIKSKPGNMTPGTDNATLDGYSEAVITKTVLALKNQSWQFKPVRRKWIPKANGKLRPLGIPSPRDKVVHQGIYMILAAIFEPSFSVHSHGFRAGRSCHTALREIRSRWSGVKWAIEGDITGCYDNVDHSILMDLLRTRIQDERFLNLIWKLLRAGFEEEGTILPSKLGCPQGGIVSPILANIYLHELDVFVQHKAKAFAGTQTRRPNPEYESLRGKRDRLRFTRSEGKSSPRNEIPWHEVRRLTKEMRALPSKDPMDPLYKKIVYVRYADDWILGVIGSKEDTKAIFKEIDAFLHIRLHLELSKEKTTITHLSSKPGAMFLGYRIQCGGKSDLSGRKKLTDIVGKSKRTVGWQPRLLVPMDRVLKRLAEKNFYSLQSGQGVRKKGWIVYEDSVIISRYNSVLRGLRNYYAPADNYGTSFNRIEYILKYSCAHTLAGKHRTHVSVQLKRKDPESISVLFTREPNRVSVWNFKGSTTMTDTALHTLFTSFAKRTSVLSHSSCQVCGATKALEMHHVRALRKGEKDVRGDYFTSMMQRMNRKQITVCRSCHLTIHSGRYDGKSLKALD